MSILFWHVVFFEFIFCSFLSKNQKIIIKCIDYVWLMLACLAAVMAANESQRNDFFSHMEKDKAKLSDYLYHLDGYRKDISYDCSVVLNQKDFSDSSGGSIFYNIFNFCASFSREKESLGLDLCDNYSISFSDSNDGPYFGKYMDYSNIYYRSFLNVFNACAYKNIVDLTRKKINKTEKSFEAMNGVSSPRSFNWLLFLCFVLSLRVTRTTVEVADEVRKSA